MALSKISNLSLELVAAVGNLPNQIDELCHSHLIEAVKINAPVPDFKADMAWLNAEKPLSFADHLSGKICVLDFFTYCCINCMHILPDLHALEEAFPVDKGVVVVGVHSGKFTNEKLAANILSAILRYDIAHPVVNDDDNVMWNGIDVHCWPTLVIVSPKGRALLYLVGEGHRNLLMKFVEVCTKFYANEISPVPVPIKLAKESLPKSTLSFPGKIALCQTSSKLLISDTGHHQVVVCDMSGLILHRIGTGQPGFKDGSFDEAMFFAPQGVHSQGNNIFVADTENHRIRMVCRQPPQLF